RSPRSAARADGAGSRAAGRAGCASPCASRGTLRAGLVGQRPDPGGDQARTGFAEQLAVGGHDAVATVGDGFVQAFLAVAVHPVVVGQVRRAERLVAGAVDAVAGHAHALVQALALGGEEVAADRLLRVAEGAHVGDHVVDRVRAAHAFEHGAPLGHDAFAPVEHGLQDLLGLAAPVPDVVGQVRV